MTFSLIAQDGKARTGILTTAHGMVETPFFMPAATRATGKHITTDDYRSIGITTLICNALLLHLRPGEQLIQKLGGLQKFMNFSGIVFTDCGGFQMSRSMFEQKSKKGLHFRSPFDQAKIILTPKKIVEVQVFLGSDVAMMLDDMSPWGASYEEAKKAMENTHRWAKESLEAHQSFRKERKSQQLLFGIIQGNFYPELRKESAKYICSLPFDGFAIGGVAIGEPLEKMEEAVAAALPFIPENKPRYVMGVGSPVEMLELIGKGIDCFDSVYPAKMARHNHLFTKDGPLILDHSVHKEDTMPIEEGCGCLTCKNFTKAYLYHLLKIQEPAVQRLKTIHNLWFITKMVEEAKAAIKNKTFGSFKTSFIHRFHSSP